jgi:hypothetical protein
MKLKQNQTLTPQRTFEFKTMAPDGYPKYIDYANDPYYDLVAPNPPTPEAVARAQFVDKTYVWKGAAPKAQLP